MRNSLAAILRRAGKTPRRSNDFTIASMNVGRGAALAHMGQCLHAILSEVASPIVQIKFRRAFALNATFRVTSHEPPKTHIRCQATVLR